MLGATSIKVEDNLTVTVPALLLYMMDNCFQHDIIDKSERGLSQPMRKCVLAI